jgi:hypothetical protein
LLETDDEFKKDVSNITGQKLLNNLTTIQTRDALLGLADSEMLRELVARRQWERRRSAGIYKASAQLQSGLSRFAEYLKCFSDLIEIVKAADQQYGGMACATLSIFLVVGTLAHRLCAADDSQMVQNKSKREETLIRTMDLLYRQIPQVTRLCNFQPSMEIATVVVNYYVKTIEFARLSQKYFSRPSACEHRF